MTIEPIRLSDAWEAVHAVNGYASAIDEQALLFLNLLDMAKESLRSELLPLVSAVNVRTDEREVELIVHRVKVRGRFCHAFTKDGYLTGRFEFTVRKDDSEVLVYSFLFDGGGGTAGICDEKPSRSIKPSLISDFLVQLIAHVQRTLHQMS